MSFYIGCGMVLTQGDKFVLVQESRGKARQGLFNLPGGTLEEHENLIDCVIREVQEETGATVKPDHFLGINHMVLDGNNVLFFVFTGRVDENIVFQSEEHEVIQTLTYDEIALLDKQGKLRAPSVLQSITDYRDGIRYPLSIVRAYHLSAIAAIVVDKD